MEAGREFALVQIHQQHTAGGSCLDRYATSFAARWLRVPISRVCRRLAQNRQYFLIVQDAQVCCLPKACGKMTQGGLRHVQQATGGGPGGQCIEPPPEPVLQRIRIPLDQSFHLQRPQCSGNLALVAADGVRQSDDTDATSGNHLLVAESLENVEIAA